MRPQFPFLVLSLIVSTLAAAQDLPPLGGSQDQKPPAQGLPPLGGTPPPAPGGLPPLGASGDLKAGSSVAGTLSVEAANADLKAARSAIAEKRYADAETLMRKDANLRPTMPPLWLELGNA